MFDKAISMVNFNLGCCQTNANQSLLCQCHCPLCRAEAAPLSQSGVTTGLEMIPLGEAALLVEMVEDGRVDGDEFLQTSHAPEALHGPFSSSERQMRILNPIVQPTTA